MYIIAKIKDERLNSIAPENSESKVIPLPRLS